MGRSITCTYHCEVNLSNGQKPIFGAMSLKDAYNNSKSFADSYGCQVVNTIVFAQTKTGQRAMKKDFIIIDSLGNKDHYSMNDKIPFYTF